MVEIRSCFYMMECLESSCFRIGKLDGLQYGIMKFNVGMSCFRTCFSSVLEFLLYDVIRECQL